MGECLYTHVDPKIGRGAKPSIDMSDNAIDQIVDGNRRSTKKNLIDCGLHIHGVR